MYGKHVHFLHFSSFIFHWIILIWLKQHQTHFLNFTVKNGSMAAVTDSHVETTVKSQWLTTCALATNKPSKRHWITKSCRFIIITSAHSELHHEQYLHRAVCCNHSIHRTLRKRIKSPVLPSHEIWLQQVAANSINENIPVISISAIDDTAIRKLLQHTFTRFAITGHYKKVKNW